MSEESTDKLVGSLPSSPKTWETQAAQRETPSTSSQTKDGTLLISAGRERRYLHVSCHLFLPCSLQRLYLCSFSRLFHFLTHSFRNWPCNFFHFQKPIHCFSDSNAHLLFARFYVIRIYFRNSKHAPYYSSNYLSVATSIFCHRAANTLFGRRYLVTAHS